METILSKHEILERYLNDVYLGQRGTYEVRGIAAVSRHYLGKEPGALRPAEVAVLVGLIRSPNTTSPLVSLQRTRERRDLVLRRLREEWRLSESEYRHALKEPVQVVRDSTVEATYFLDFVRKELEAKLSGASGGGTLKVFTALDVAMQQAVQQAVVRGLLKLDGRRAKEDARACRGGRAGGAGRAVWSHQGDGGGEGLSTQPV